MTTSAESPTEYSTLSLRKEAKARLESLKPYDSMSWTEFCKELADVYEESEAI